MKYIWYDQQGVTLIEIMLVLMIALLLGTLGLPTYADLMARHRLNAATVQVMSDLMLARRRALSQQHSVQLLFSDKEDQAYQIWDDFDNNNKKIEEEIEMKL